MHVLDGVKWMVLYWHFFKFIIYEKYYDKPKSTENIVLLASDKCYAFKLLPLPTNHPDSYSRMIQIQHCVHCCKKTKKKASAAAKWTTVCEAQREGSDKVREEARCQVGSCLLDECSSKMTCQGLTPHVQFIPLLSHNTLHTATHSKN